MSDVHPQDEARLKRHLAGSPYWPRKSAADDLRGHPDHDPVEGCEPPHRPTHDHRRAMASRGSSVLVCRRRGTQPLAAASAGGRSKAAVRRGQIERRQMADPSWMQELAISVSFASRASPVWANAQAAPRRCYQASAYVARGRRCMVSAPCHPRLARRPPSVARYVSPSEGRTYTWGHPLARRGRRLTRHWVRTFGSAHGRSVDSVGVMGLR
jgi:hypothetical protein